MTETTPDTKQSGCGCCKRTVATTIREWIIREQMERVGVRTTEFSNTQGYLLCLSNLIELLQTIERPCHACIYKDPAWSDPNPVDPLMGRTEPTSD